MPTIPYPDVPAYAGVPPIPRTSPGSPSINMNLASTDSSVTSSTSSEPQWGIFDSSNNPIYTPTAGGTLSVLSFGFTRSMQVSDFPIEANSTGQGAAFASFNKVYQPSNPVVTLALSGTEDEKTAFLSAIDAACQSTTLYNALTPDASYTAANGYGTIERYSYQRTATHGATMLIVEVSMKQVLQVTAALSNVSNGTTGITAPQSPSAAASVNNGITQTSPAPGSWLASIAGPNGPGTVGF